MRLKQAKLLTGLPGRPNTHMRRLGAPGVGDGTSRVAKVSGLPAAAQVGIVGNRAVTSGQAGKPHLIQGRGRYRSFHIAPHLGS